MTEHMVGCPKCSGRRVIFKERKRRVLQMSPLGRKRCFLHLLPHRCKRLECGHLWWPRLPFPDGKDRYVRFFALTVPDMLKFGTITAVAEFLSIPLHKVKYIEVDELSPRKGHEHMAVFM